MPFPQSERIEYAKNPLVEVVCQLKFPPILRIDTELPASFQEAIREHFPLFEQKLSSPFALPQDIADVFQIQSGAASAKNYHFKSEDEQWTVNLTRDFIALTTMKYIRWENFKERLSSICRALVDIYQPRFFSRIGLRYRDVIQRTSLGLEKDTNWAELLAPCIAGELSSSDVKSDITHIAKDVRLRLPAEMGTVNIKHGLMVISNEECYLIDSDFFKDTRTTVGEHDVVLDRFKREASRFFRWCISDRLHEAMEPSSINDSGTA